MNKMEEDLLCELCNQYKNGNIQWTSEEFLGKNCGQSLLKNCEYEIAYRIINQKRKRMLI